MMDIYNLGTVSWWESQCFYHALAYLGREGVIICRPAEAYVCLGLHDDLDQEIDTGFCRDHGLPIIRRETGGGVVLLDSGQIFYQVVLSRTNPMLPARRAGLFCKILAPAIETLRSLGIDAEIALPADIKAGGRKCSGNAAGDIGSGAAYIGNLIVEFDHETMSRVLKTPSELFRSMLCRAMRENMLTIADTGADAGSKYLESKLIEGFEILFGKMNDRTPDSRMRDMARELNERLASESWLNMPGRRSSLRSVKISEGLYLRETEINGGGHETVLVRYGIAEAVAELAV